MPRKELLYTIYFILYTYNYYIHSEENGKISLLVQNQSKILKRTFRNWNPVIAKSDMNSCEYFNWVCSLLSDVIFTVDEIQQNII